MLIDDTRQKAEILNKQYHSVFTPECENEELASLTDNYPSMPEITVTAKGNEKLLSKLNPSKATGPDEISSRILKQYAHEFAPLLTTIFNASLSRGEVSTDVDQGVLTCYCQQYVQEAYNIYMLMILACNC
jgi:hypothetical protein